MVAINPSAAQVAPLAAQAALLALRQGQQDKETLVARQALAVEQVVAAVALEVPVVLLSQLQVHMAQAVRVA